MKTKAVLYARVSSEEQAKGDAVSIDSQLADMRQLCERNGWQIHNTFVDCENYQASQQPKKGKTVSPSGERADRPQFLAMLDAVRGGGVDVVLCWRDDRLMRHPRVAVALEDALDVGDVARVGGGRPAGKITIHDATGAPIDRFTLSIKAVIWREENKRRVERITMGKVGVLEKGRWPGKYGRLGYIVRREEGKRGCFIELSDPSEVQTVKDIFNWYDKGLAINDIRKRLIKRGDRQNGLKRLYDWSSSNILKILRAEDYTGVATWEFEDRKYTIKVPAIVSREQWERVQKRINNNRRLSSRNSSRVFVFQHLIECGECGGRIAPNMRYYYHTRLASGKLKRYSYDTPRFQYRCTKRKSLSEHPSPYNWDGNTLEWAIWRYIVDNGIKRPDLIIEQVQARQQQLIEQGDSVNGDIGRARLKLAEIDQERAFYQRQAARGTISEQEFDLRMTETKDTASYWQEELGRLQELRDNAAKVRVGIDYTIQVLQAFESRLGEIDIPPHDLEKMPQEQQENILKERQKIVRALCDKITIYADGQIIIDGLLDGSEHQQFDIPSQKIGVVDKSLPPTGQGCSPGHGRTA